MSALLRSYVWLVAIAFPPPPSGVIFARLRRQELEPLAFAEE
jgi:hypothetical protein